MNDPRLKAERFYSGRGGVDSYSVIPVKTGIQAVNELETKTNLDAGLRRHDGFAFLTGERIEPSPGETGIENRQE
jgi:hypothetical protein